MQKAKFAALIICTTVVLTSCTVAPGGNDSKTGNILSSVSSSQVPDLPVDTPAASSHNNTSESNIKYTLKETQLQYVHNDTIFTFPGLEFDTYPDEEKMRELNSLLKNTMLEWVTDDCSWLSNSKIEVIYKSEDYLSIKRTCESWGSRSDILCNYVTLNLNKAKRITFYELLPNDTEASGYLKDISTVFANWSDEKVDAFLRDVSLSEAEYLSISKAPSTFSALLFKPGFYISPDGVVHIKRNEIEADDIATHVSQSHGDG